MYLIAFAGMANSETLLLLSTCIIFSYLFLFTEGKLLQIKQLNHGKFCGYQSTGLCRQN